MQNNFTTERLNLSPLTLQHDEFILELVNTPGWLRFIGDRNIHNAEDAQAYINRIDETEFTYWVVSIKGSGKPIGVITFVKRDYLGHPDLGFAFLPEYIGAGYAFEAASVIKDHLVKHSLAEKLLATTIPDNVLSIKLLTRLGFIFQQQIENEGETLSVYELNK